MVITLSDGKDTFYFPVNPSEIEYQAETYFQTYNIINKGTVKVPKGDDVTIVRWEGFFPGEKLKNAPYVRKWEAPAVKHKYIENHRINGTKLKLNITGTPFSFWVYIDSYEASMKDAMGNIHYRIEFSKVVNISVDTVKAKVVKTTGNARTSTQSKTYTIKSGDTLWAIAVKYYGKGIQWTKIYNANKSVIEAAAKKHKKKSSSNGHWIYPGTTLNIP